MSSTALDIRQARELVEFDQEQVDRYKKQFEADIYVPAKVTDPNKRQALAQVLAEVKIFYDLEPLSGEVAIGSFSGDQYGLIIQHQGWRKIARREAMKELGSLVNFSRPEILSPAEIEKRQAHICQRCNGTGKFKMKNGNEGQCKACQGQSKFDPKEVIAMEVRMTVLEELKEFKAAGAEYTPIVGLGVWQPGGNSPTSKDPRWKCEVNAVKDCVRQRFSLTMADRFNKVFGQPVQFMTDAEAAEEEGPPPKNMGEAKVVDLVAEDIRALVEAHGLKISRPHLFEQTVKAALAKGLFTDAAEFVQVMVDNEFEFDPAKLDHFKLLMSCAHEGTYPLDLASGEAPLSGSEKLLFFSEVQDRHGLDRGKLGQLWSQVYGKDNKILQAGDVSRIEAYNFLYYLDTRVENDGAWNKQLAHEAAALSAKGKRFGQADGEEVKPGEVIDQEKADVAAA